MQRMRNKKRLTTLVIAFLMVFVIGSAFAMVPGMLDVSGRVHFVADQYVIWNQVFHQQAPGGPIVIVPAMAVDGSTQIASIGDRPAGLPRTRQRISWNVYFSEFDTSASAAIAATIQNNHNQNVEVTEIRIIWRNNAGVNLQAPTVISAAPFVGPATSTLTDFGLTVTIEDFWSALDVLLPNGAVSDEIDITLSWNGTLPSPPPANTMGTPVTATSPSNLSYHPGVQLYIEFDYSVI